MKLGPTYSTLIICTSLMTIVPERIMDCNIVPYDMCLYLHAHKCPIKHYTSIAWHVCKQSYFDIYIYIYLSYCQRCTYMFDVLIVLCSVQSNELKVVSFGVVLDRQWGKRRLQIATTCFSHLEWRENNSRPTWRNSWFSRSKIAMRRQSALMKEANSTMTTSKQQFQDMKNMIERDLDAKKAGTAPAQDQLLDLVRSGHEWNAWPVWPPISSGLAGNLCFAFQFWLIPIWNGVGNDWNVSLMSWHSEAMKSA